MMKFCFLQRYSLSSGAGVQDRMLKKILKVLKHLINNIVDQIILTFVSAALFFYPQPTPGLMRSSHLYVECKGKIHIWFIGGFVEHARTCCNWTTIALQSPSEVFQKDIGEAKILPIGKIASSVSDYLLCMEGERAKVINPWELISRG
jgi:hypothetical protein